MTDWAKLKVVDLKAELKRRDLPQHGLKAELVARLAEADQAEDDQPENEDQVEAQDENEDADEGEDAPKDGDNIATEESPAREPPASTEPEATPVADAEPQGVVADSDAPVASTTDQEGHKIANDAADSLADTIDPQKPDAHEDTALAQGAVAKSMDEPLPPPQPTQEVASELSTTDASRRKDHNIEDVQDSQKRKRRSASPPPNAEAVAKRARVAAGEDLVDAATNGGVDPAEKEANVVTAANDVAQDLPLAMEDVKNDDHVQKVHSSASDAVDHPYDEMDLDRTVSPSIHPATPALYIANLMRPLRPSDIQTHLIDLATPAGVPMSHDIITTFHLDTVRTHAFVVFTTTSAASRVRTLLHDCVWPNESNRKALWVDFIPQEKVSEWIEREEHGNGNGGRFGTRWEVVYGEAPDGSVEARLETANAASSRAGPAPSQPRPANDRLPAPVPADSLNSIPLGPRSQREIGNIPTGPRSKRSGPGPRPPPGSLQAPVLGLNAKRTIATPVVTYQTVSEDLARTRITNMRSFYKSGSDRRDLGSEINRYSFEDGATFVDRGKEVFIGIRPPHRQRAIDRDRRGGGGGGGGGGGPPRRRGPPPFRSRSDRYFPGGDDRGSRDDKDSRRDWGARDDKGFRDGRLSRDDKNSRDNRGSRDDRDRGSRNDRGSRFSDDRDSYRRRDSRDRRY